MSEASIATSVPVPIARPRSAWASAGASLTPSPTIATTRPSSCSRRMTSALPAGQDVGDDLVDPDLGRDRAGGRGVVAGQQHRPRARAPLSSAIACALDGLAASATTSRPRAAPSQPAATTVWPSACGLARAASSSRGQAAWPHSARSARPAGDDRVAVDDALDAEALAVAERLDRGERAGLALGAAGDGAGDGMLGGVLERADEAQHLALGRRRRRRRRRAPACARS